MGQLFSHWDNDPFFIDSYNSPFIYYFDLILLPISSIIVTVIFLQWIFQLHCSAIQKTVRKAIDPKKQEASSIGSRTTSNDSKGKPKVDLSLPTISKTQQIQQKELLQTTQISQPTKQNQAELTEESSNKSKKEKPKSKSKAKAKIKRHQEIHPISKALTTTSIFCAMLYLWCTLAIVILSTSKKHPKCYWISLDFEIVYTQRYCLYMYYLFRSHLTFQKSSHEISRRQMIYIVSAITVIWVFGEIFYIVWNSVINNCTEGSNIISIIPLGVTETCTSSFCVWLFYSKLKRVYSSKRRNSKSGGKEQSVNYKLQYLFSKLMILAGTAIGTTFCVLSFWPFSFAFGLMAIDTPINVSCMVLSFAFYDKYYRIFCAPCRRCFEPPRPPPIDLKADCVELEV